ncbi:MAG: NAD(P)H-dependent oxidoreductase subunit E [Pseudomonadota bacterium]
MPDGHAATIRALIAPHLDVDGGLLPALHAVVEDRGWIEEPSITVVADAFNLSRAEVFGVVSFYDDFRTTPPGRHVVKLCRAEACQAVGAERLVRTMEERLASPIDATSADGRVTLESVYCLGNCALGPAALVDGELRGRVDAADLCTRLAL